MNQQITADQQISIDFGIEKRIRDGVGKQNYEWSANEVKALLRLIDGLRKYITDSNIPRQIKLAARNQDLKEYNIRSKINNPYSTWSNAVIQPLLTALDKLRNLTKYIAA